MTAEAIAVATTDSRHARSASGAALDIFRVRQYFNVVVGARDMARAIRADARFLDAVRRGLLPLPSDRQAQLAREHLARLRRQARTLLVEPVPYWKVAGTGFYEQFLDNREWPQFMRARREATLATLRQHALPSAA